MSGNMSGSIAPGLQIRLEAARAAGCRIEPLDPETGYLFAIERDGTRQLLLGGLSPLNDAVAMAIASDKFHCATVLEAAGFRVPRHTRCLRPGRFADDDFASHAGIRSLRAFVDDIGWPVIAKPGHGARGRDVVAVRDMASLEAAVERIWRNDHLAVVESVAEGIDLRIDMLDDTCLVAYLRRPLAGHRPGDPVLNLNRRATADVIDPLPEPWRHFAGRIRRALDLRHLGIDLKIRDLDADPSTACVIEVNASPSMEQIAIRGHEDQVLRGETLIIEAILEAAHRATDA